MSIKIINSKFQIPNSKQLFWSLVIGQLFIICNLVFGAWNFVIALEPPKYEINALIDTTNHKIEAKQKVIFTNNSDKEISEIYFHIYPHRKYESDTCLEGPVDDLPPVSVELGHTQVGV